MPWEIGESQKFPDSSVRLVLVQRREMVLPADAVSVVRQGKRKLRRDLVISAVRKRVVKSEGTSRLAGFAGRER